MLWASAVHWAAAVALLKLYLHIPLAAAVALGVLGVAGNLAVERSLWRRNQVRLSQVLDPITGELPGGRVPLPLRVRYGLVAWSVGLVAIVVYLAAA